MARGPREKALQFPRCLCGGDGPRFLWTRSEGRPRRVGRQLSAGEVGKVRREVARQASGDMVLGATLRLSADLQ